MRRDASVVYRSPCPEKKSVVERIKNFVEVEGLDRIANQTVSEVICFSFSPFSLLSPSSSIIFSLSCLPLALSAAFLSSRRVWFGRERVLSLLSAASAIHCKTRQEKSIHLSILLSPLFISPCCLMPYTHLRAFVCVLSLGWYRFQSHTFTVSRSLSPFVPLICLVLSGRDSLHSHSVENHLLPRLPPFSHSSLFLTIIRGT